MTVYKFTSPEGKTYRVTAPEGATQEQAYAILQQSLDEKTAPANNEYASPYGDASGPKNLAFGVARGVADIGNTLMKIPGLKQLGQAGYKMLGGTGSREQALAEMDAERKGSAYDAGRVIGNVAATFPVGGAIGGVIGKVPGLASIAPALRSGGMSAGNLTGKTALAARLGGGATVGGASAALIDPQDVATGAAIGAIAPPIIQGAIRAGVGAGRGMRAIVQPWTGEAGQRAVASDALRYTGIPAVPITPGPSGVVPTLAEELARIGNPVGAERAGRLLDSMNINPEIGPIISQVLRENNAGRLQALQGLGGGVDDAIKARAQAAGPMYEKAWEATPTAGAEDWMRMGELMERPAVEEGMIAATRNLQNANIDPNLTRSLHEAQMAMRARMENLRKPGSAASDESAAQAIETARTDLLKTLGNLNPDYSAARNKYREASRPVNQAQVYDAIYDKASGALSDITGEPRLQAAKVLNAVRDESKMVQDATGRKGLGDFSQVFDQSQLGYLRSILGEIDRSAAVASAATGSNSATARRAYTSNALHQMLGPLGMSRGAIESPMVQNLLRFPTMLARVPEDKVQEQMAQILLGRRPMTNRTPWDFNRLEELIRPAAVPLAIQE